MTLPYVLRCKYLPAYGTTLLGKVSYLHTGIVTNRDRTIYLKVSLRKQHRMPSWSISRVRNVRNISITKKVGII